MRTYQVITAATTYPVSLTEAKLHLKVDITTDDTLITNLIIAATQVSEEYTNRFFINTVVNQTCSNFNELKELYKSKVSAVTHVKYYDTDNAQQTLAASNYVVNNEYEPCQINIDVDGTFPSIADRIDAVECKYTVGYGAASDVPYTIKTSILLTIGNWYENRMSVITGRTTTELPQSAMWLLDTYKVQVVR
tara:strand:+ start:1183 stop:1758 length:576 start_codon:yes stop_codon:yes gene_type:complete